MKTVILLAVAAIASSQQHQQQQQEQQPINTNTHFMPSCQCDANSAYTDSCMGAFSKKGRFTYRYETTLEQYIPGYNGTSEFRMSAMVDFWFHENSCIGEMQVYDVMAYDTSFRGVEYQGDIYNFLRQQAEKHDELELFYRYNETLPRYRLYFCYSDFNFQHLYQHLEEPIWSLNFKRGILSTFQAEFCPTRYHYKSMENAVNADICSYEYRIRPYNAGNFTVTKEMLWDQCQQRKSNTMSSVYGRWFAEGEKPVYTKSSSMYKYYNNITQYIWYEESHELRLSGFQLQFTADEDWGSLFSIVRQYFYFQKYDRVDTVPQFMGLDRTHYSSRSRSLQYEEFDFYSKYGHNYDNMNEAMELVRKITEFKREPMNGDFLDMFYELQQRFRHFTYAQFRTMFEQFESDVMCMRFEREGRFTCRRTLFEAVMAVGSDTSAMFFRYLIHEHNSYFSMEDQLFGMWSFIFSEHSSETILHSIYDTCEYYRSNERFWGRCALALGAMTKRYCEYNYNECPYFDYTDERWQNWNGGYNVISNFEEEIENTPPYYAKIFLYFYRVFESNRFTYNSQAFFALKAINNMASADNYDYMRTFYRFHREVAFNVQYPMQYRLAAMQSFARCIPMFYEELYPEFFAMFRDESQPTEMRIVAFNNMMYTFKFGSFYLSSAKWQEVFGVMDQTHDYQLYCYAYSYLSRMVETAYFPDRFWTRQLAYYFGKSEYFFTSRVYKCKNMGYLGSQVQQYSLPTGFFPRFTDFRFSSSVECSKNKTFTFPRRFNFFLDGYVYNYDMRHFEFGFESPDFRRFFDYFTSPDAFVYRDHEQRTNPYEFKFFFFMRMFEFDMLWEEFDQDDVEHMFENNFKYYKLYKAAYTFFQDGYSYKGLSNLMFEMKQWRSLSGIMSFFTDSTYWNQTYGYSNTFRGFDFRHTVPTRMGFPLVYNFTSLFHVQMIMNHEISCDETCQYSYGLIPDRVKNTFYISPRYAARFYGSVSLYTTYFAQSLQFEMSAHGGFDQSHYTTIYDDGRVEYDYTLPQTYTQLATFGGKFFFYYYRFNQPHRYFQYHGQPAYSDWARDDFMRPMPYFYDDSYNCSWCYRFADYSGFNLTTISQYANFTRHYHGYPLFPFSGEFNFTLGATPRQWHNGRFLSWQETNQLYTTQPRARYTFHFRNFSNYQTMDVAFYPPVYGQELYSNATFTYHFERRPYFDNHGFRYFNISAYGRRYPMVSGHYVEMDNYTEYFHGYFAYRDFEGNFQTWFGRSLFNATFLWNFYNPCFNFTTVYRGNRTGYFFDTRFFYHDSMKVYNYISEGTMSPRESRGYWNMHHDQEFYYFNYQSTRRFFMNDFDVQTNFEPFQGLYKYQPFNFFAILPPTDFEQCHVYDKSYQTFDGYHHNVNHGCGHYLVENDYFSITRANRDNPHHHDVRVEFTQRYGGKTYIFSPNHFTVAARQHTLSTLTENREYNFEEFSVRRVLGESCGCYRVYFHRFHFMMYICPHSINIGMSPTAYFGRSRGICGNMNYNPDDDMMMRHSNMVTADRMAFFRSYSVGGVCHDHNDHSYPVMPFSNAQFNESYQFCYAAYKQMYSHCNSTIPASAFLYRCAEVMKSCHGNRERCLKRTLCAYAMTCHSAGYYPMNSCMVSEWWRQERSHSQWRDFSMQDHLPFYNSKYFNEFTLHTPSWPQRFDLPASWLSWYRMQSGFNGTYTRNNKDRCTRTRVSNWYYMSSKTSLYFKSGFQWCQREGDYQMSFRYTLSNIFNDVCPTTRCCMQPTTKPIKAYLYWTIGNQRAKSAEMWPTCPQGTRVGTFTKERVLFLRGTEEPYRKTYIPVELPTTCFWKF
ncbi:uncharacterized protein LOC135806657 [Sycon ciliatum]|uniref:uncharacterized protein LOC135806657 n=1 Tax=Sycon ciliatum TaxID=27933 RepID=UPI0031F70E5E